MDVDRLDVDLRDPSARDELPELCSAGGVSGDGLCNLGTNAISTLVAPMDRIAAATDRDRRRGCLGVESDGQTGFRCISRRNARENVDVRLCIARSEFQRVLQYWADRRRDDRVL